MSDAPIMQTSRNPMGEWSDSNNMIDQSKVNKLNENFQKHTIIQSFIQLQKNSCTCHCQAIEAHC